MSINNFGGVQVFVANLLLVRDQCRNEFRRPQQFFGNVRIAYLYLIELSGLKNK